MASIAQQHYWKNKPGDKEQNEPASYTKILESRALNPAACPPGAIAGSNPCVTYCIIPPKCNTSRDGLIIITGTLFGTGPYTYEWTGGTLTSNVFNDTLTGIGGGTYGLTVTDQSDGTDCQDFVVVVAPNPILHSFSKDLPNCFGECTGSITSQPVGGTPPYTYFWKIPGASNQTTQTAINLCATTGGLRDSVIVTDSLGCSKAFGTTLAQPAQIQPNLNIPSILCYGGTVNISSAPSGGYGPYDFIWSPSGSTNDTLFSVSVGTYTLDVTDDSLCTNNTIFTITQPSSFSATITKQDISCFGANDGTATVTNPTGGTPFAGNTYQYSWNPTGQTTQTATGLGPGTYTVTVTDANSCSAYFTITITQPTDLQAAVNATQLTCNNICSSTITSNVSGGSPGYTYVWKKDNVVIPGATGTFLDDQCAGAYKLIVTDIRGCKDSANVTVNQPTAFTVATSFSNPKCKDDCNGSASASGGGSTPPYTYSWSPGPIPGPNVSGLCAGTYTVTVTDFNGCTKDTTVTLTEPNILIANETKIDVSCNGVCDGKGIVSPIGGTQPYSYNWLPAGVNNDTLLNQCPGTYTVTVTDANGCVTPQASITISQPSPFSATIAATTTSCTVCNGSATVAATGGTRPYTYSWTGSSSIDSLAPNLCPGTYTVTVTDARGCQTTAIATVILTVQIQITSSGTELSCPGTCDGIATVNASGGRPKYSYLWSPAAPDTSTLTGLCVGKYYVTVTDQDGCQNRDSIEFINPPAINATVSKTDLSCNAACDGSAQVDNPVTGGTGPYTFSWSPGGQTTQSISGLCAGTYTVTIRDSKNCPLTQTISVTQSPAIAITYTTISSNCNTSNGSIIITASGGNAPYTFTWPAGTAVSGTSPSSTASNLNAGSYTVIVTDVTGCSETFTVGLSDISGPDLAMSTLQNAWCYNSCEGISSVTPSGGAGGPYTNFNWTPDPASGEGTNTASGFCAGIYNVEVEDAAGCLSVGIDTITEPTPLVISFNITSVSCNGGNNGSVSFNVSGGTPGYQYNFNGLGFSSVSTYTGIAAGTYPVIIKDNNNCDSLFNITITEPLVITSTMSSSNINCFGECSGRVNVDVTGGTFPYTYSWQTSSGNVLPGIILDSVINLCANTYIVTITDNKGCVSSDTAIIVSPALLFANINKTNITCYGLCTGGILITGSGGTTFNAPNPPYTYTWNPNVAAGPSATNLCAGTYNFTLTDANNCFLDTAIVITEPSEIILTPSSTNALCNGACSGTASVISSGGTPGIVNPYTYVWSPTAQSTAAVTALCPGTYTVTVTDSLSCSQSEIINISSPPRVDASAMVTSPVCSGDCNGSAAGSGSGGTGAFTFVWQNTLNDTISNTNTASGLCDGDIYSLIVTDANNCKDSIDVTIPQGTSIDVSASISDASCGSSDGKVTVIPSTGTAPYSFIWPSGVNFNSLPAGAATWSEAFDLPAGFYNVTVTDANGCDSTFTYAVSNAGGPVAVTTKQDATCSYSCDGRIEADTSLTTGGTGPYSYAWFDISGNLLSNNTDSIGGLCAGDYYLRVIETTIPCTSFVRITINPRAPILGNPSIIQNTCNGICDGEIGLSTTGGTAPYTYNWSTDLPGNFTAETSIDSLCNGDYTVIIRDMNGCLDTATYTLNPINILAADIITVGAGCNNSCNGSATAVVNSGTPNYTYTWNDPLAQQLSTASGLCAGTYNVTISDAMGCSITLPAIINASSITSLNASVTDAACGQCDGIASVNPAGLAGPYTVAWSSGQTGNTANNLCAGVHTVAVTDTAGCTTNFSLPVSTTAGPSFSVTPSPTTCENMCNGSASISSGPTGGQAPYRYLWIPGGETTTSITSLCEGTYFLQVTDTIGCTSIDSVQITAPGEIKDNRTVINPACGASTGSISLNPSGGNGTYSYTWLPGGQVTDSIGGLSAGTYTVTITSGGCSETFIIPVSNSSLPNVTIVSTNPNCGGECTGTATVTAAGGSGFYTYTWFPLGGNGFMADSLCPGTYVVQVTDNNTGCIASAQAIIAKSDTLALSMAYSINPRCSLDCSGIIGAVPSGGTLPYSFLWTPSNQNTATAGSLCAGTYTVNVTDSKGCTATQSASIFDHPEIIITLDNVIPASCSSVNDASAFISVSGGVPYKAPKTLYTYSWNGPSPRTTEDVTNILYGTYTVIAFDSLGCSDTLIVDIAALDTVIAAAGNDTVFCSGSTFILNGSSSYGDLTTTEWKTLPGDSLISTSLITTINPPDGTTGYVLYVSDGVCSHADTIYLTSNLLPVVDAGNFTIILINESTTIGGNPTCSSCNSYLWSSISDLQNTAANPVVTPTVTTTYTVVGTDANGCSSFDTVTVRVIPKIVFPNGVSPNGDGANDEWFIDNIEMFPECMVEIYNRWGELVFSSPGYKKRWDGTYNGKPLPVGTYYYIINLNHPLFPDAFTGPITILR